MTPAAATPAPRLRRTDLQPPGKGAAGSPPRDSARPRRQHRTADPPATKAPPPLTLIGVGKNEIIATNRPRHPGSRLTPE